MSDFLTNLVVRSFSPAPSFQPMVAPAASTYVEPYETVTETPVTATAKPPVPIADERVVNTPVVPAESIGHHELPPVAPEKFEPVKHEFQEQSVVPAASLETTDPRPETPPVVESPVQPATRQLMRKAVRATPQPKPAAPRLRTTTRRASATHKSEPPIVEQVVEHVTEHLTQQVVERPAVTIENHHEITKIQNRHEINEIESHQEINKQEITSSFTTLVPKPAVQPLPLPHVRKTRSIPPLAQPPDEVQPPAALPPETVVNVAIGRIEVRATPATTPRRERPSGPKIMTLDDYVQQRSRGAQ